MLRKVLNSEECVDILKNIIESILEIKIKKIELNPYLYKRTKYLPAEENFGIADVRITKDDNEELNVGIQFIDGKYIPTKILMYYEQIHANQLEHDEKREFCRTITINILDFVYFSFKNFCKKIKIQCNENFVKTEGEKLCIVSQTTYNYNKFQYIVEIFEKKGYNDSVVNTICNATEERQRSAKTIAADADVMIVIGGKHSSNSRKLYEICQRECEHTYFIQTLDDLHLDLPKAVRLVGITAGASTPNKLIEEVQNYVRINF